MTFIEFLKELQKKLNDSDLYHMTKQSLKILRSYRYHTESDKNVIYDAINNDTAHNKDPLSLRDWWNEKKTTSILVFNVD